VSPAPENLFSASEAASTAAPRAAGRGGLLLDRLTQPGPLVTVELRPPPAGLGASESMDAWIDMHHGFRKLTAAVRFVFVTDNAVGRREEENLSHLIDNLGEGADPTRVIPFLTLKHTLEYCLVYAERAAHAGFQALTVLGGDQRVGAPRCLPHAHLLRSRIRERVPTLALGGWANPHRRAAEQAGFLADAEVRADFFLTQVVSHHAVASVEAFLKELRTRDVDMPGVFGVFYYRSAKPETLTRLSEFFPVPVEALIREFAAGATADEVCARSIRALRDAGAERIYVSNLGLARPEAALRRILDLV
jgi:5,10-methylenetetrahydrofolate reductase